MADEVYDGAIGIDLGKSLQPCKNSAIALARNALVLTMLPYRYHLFLRRQLRGNKCRNQYVSPLSHFYACSNI
jgi:hypothetical protein